MVKDGREKLYVLKIKKIKKIEAVDKLTRYRANKSSFPLQLHTVCKSLQILANIQKKVISKREDYSQIDYAFSS